MRHPRKLQEDRLRMVYIPLRAALGAKQSNVYSSGDIEKTSEFNDIDRNMKERNTISKSQSSNSSHERLGSVKKSKSDVITAVSSPTTHINMPNLDYLGRNPQALKIDQQINHITTDSESEAQDRSRKRLRLDTSAHTDVAATTDPAPETATSMTATSQSTSLGTTKKGTTNTPVADMTSVSSGSLPTPAVDTSSPVPAPGPATQFTPAASIGLREDDVPTTAAGIATHRYDPSSSFIAPRLMGLYTVQMMNRSLSLTPQKTQVVYNILKSFNSLEVFTAETNRLLQIKSILLMIQGEVNGGDAMKASKPFSYPASLTHLAEQLQARLDNDLAVEEADLAATAQPPIPTSATIASRRSNSTPSAPLIRSTDPTLNHIMRGILLTTYPRRTMSLDRTYPKRSFANFGPNGLQIGDWWPYRIALLRDGAHGSLQGGISGSSQRGAYSIVISSDYSTLDSDKGDTIYYSGSNSHDNRDPDRAHVTTATQSLQVSFRCGLDVRVIRGGGRGEWAPSCGFRYEGVFRIVEERMERNERGGAYLRFKFVRRRGQGGWDRERPTRREREIFETLKGGEVGW